MLIYQCKSDLAFVRAKQLSLDPSGYKRPHLKLGGAVFLKGGRAMANKVFYLKSAYFSALCADPEFERNNQRPYYRVTNVNYRGRTIAVAVPLRSNINKAFQKNPDEFIATAPTPHTLTGKGNIAGWHFTKMIPIDPSLAMTVAPNNPDMVLALMIADSIKHSEFIEKTKRFVSRLEKGEFVFGAIDFDNALSLMDSLIP